MPLVSTETPPMPSSQSTKQLPSGRQRAMPPNISLLTSRGHPGTHPYKDCGLSDRSPGVNAHQRDVGSNSSPAAVFCRGGMHREGNMAIPTASPLPRVLAGYLGRGSCGRMPNFFHCLWGLGWEDLATADFGQARDVQMMQQGETRGHGPRTIQVGHHVGLKPQNTV